MNGAVATVVDSGWIPPVDTVIEMDSGTSPAAIYADTVWTQLKDCIIIAAGNTFRAGTSGGQVRIALTSANLPSHTHSGTVASARNHSHTTTSRRDNYASANDRFDNGIQGNQHAGQVTVTTSSAGAHTHTATIGSTGSGQAFNIMNPYYAVNIWQRVG